MWRPVVVCRLFGGQRFAPEKERPFRPPPPLAAIDGRRDSRKARTPDFRDRHSQVVHRIAYGRVLYRVGRLTLPPASHAR